MAAGSHCHCSGAAAGLGARHASCTWRTLRLPTAERLCTAHAASVTASHTCMRARRPHLGFRAPWTHQSGEREIFLAADPLHDAGGGPFR